MASGSGPAKGDASVMSSSNRSMQVTHASSPVVKTTSTVGLQMARTSLATRDRDRSGGMDAESTASWRTVAAAASVSKAVIDGGHRVDGCAFAPQENWDLAYFRGTNGRFGVMNERLRLRPSLIRGEIGSIVLRMPSMPVPAPIRIPRRAIFCIATLFGVSSTIQGALLMRIAGKPYIEGDFIQLPVLNLAYWYVPALLAPVIMGLAVRYQLGRVKWWTQVAVHGTGVLVYGAVHTATMFALRGALTWALTPPPMPEPRTFWQRVGYEGLYQFDWQLMTYLSLVGLAHALAYRRESERRTLEASRLETRLVEAQLQSLQRQLHPHFLFNTLNTIAGLIRTNVNAADAMIDQLGDLLRMALQTSNRQEVPLKQELEALRKYLDIEQTRLGPRLKVQMRIDPDTLDAEVPNLLLQPLVENAVRHGISPHSRPGWIAIESSQSNGRLVLDVRDSGYGVPPERLIALNSGVGLRNTRARLEHLYPGAHEFTFANLPDGFSVGVSIPFRRVDAEPEAVEVEVA
jgi:two-component system, LytTR family, sensor kinase